MRLSRAAATLLLCSSWVSAQVVAPAEIGDPQMRQLQEKHLKELKLFTQAADALQFPYRFYFSRALDLSEKEQQRHDQRSIQFDHYQNKVVLKITGNYYASYSTALLKPEERARQTYKDVILPLLQAAVPPLEKVEEIQAFAFEVSHHVRKKVIGVSSEGVENVVVIVPQKTAVRLVAARDPATQQALISEGEAFLNAAPISLWPREGVEFASAPAPPAPVKASQPAPTVSPKLLSTVSGSSPVLAKAIPAVADAELLRTSPPPNSSPARDTSPDALKSIQASYQATLDRMVQELNSQAHFVRYAPPALIPFHNGLFLQLSVTTSLPESANGSQYKLAALAFDQHIAHLIRPALSYFKEDRGDIDGIDFSTSVRLGSGQSSEGSSVAVEFIFPLKLLREYAQFDYTGQQLIDASYVLINGERVGLNLQIAEAGSQLK